MTQVRQEGHRNSRNLSYPYWESTYNLCQLVHHGLREPVIWTVDSINCVCNEDPLVSTKPELIGSSERQNKSLTFEIPAFATQEVNLSTCSQRGSTASPQSHHLVKRLWPDRRCDTGNNYYQKDWSELERTNQFRQQYGPEACQIMGGQSAQKDSYTKKNLALHNGCWNVFQYVN